MMVRMQRDTIPRCVTGARRGTRQQLSDVRRLYAMSLVHFMHERRRLSTSGYRWCWCACTLTLAAYTHRVVVWSCTIAVVVRASYRAAKFVCFFQQSCMPGRTQVSSSVLRELLQDFAFHLEKLRRPCSVETGRSRHTQSAGAGHYRSLLVGVPWNSK